MAHRDRKSPQPIQQPRANALQIWRAGVEAVRAERLVPQWLRLENGSLVLGNDAVESPSLVLALDSIRRLAVVGAGKAGAGMAAAVETVLGDRLLVEKDVVGWVNVPADCLRPLKRIHLHAARPAGLNEPTPEGVAGSLEILRLVESLGEDDFCLCLISGGGSALLPAPAEGISLADKVAVTRHLSAAGATIEELNTVRKQLSRIKGGGLWRACRAGRMAALVISDVLGDPLDVIASGPTVPDASTPRDALDVLKRFHARDAGVSPAVFEYLTGRESREARPHPSLLPRGEGTKPCDHFVIGNNATAVAAAAREAERLGYATISTSAKRSEGRAEDVGCRLAETTRTLRAAGRPACLLSGGEPVVSLVEPSRRGLGGRNQQLCLAALERLAETGCEGVTLLSGGTDGEDGPTDAAGAFIDAEVLAAARRQGLAPADFLARNDAYHFFAAVGALLRTGPTQTNACDLRVVLAR